MWRVARPSPKIAQGIYDGGIYASAIDSNEVYAG